jgi:hypothetical protein
VNSARLNRRAVRSSGLMSRITVTVPEPATGKKWFSRFQRYANSVPSTESTVAVRPDAATRRQPVLSPRRRRPGERREGVLRRAAGSADRPPRRHEAGNGTAADRGIDRLAGVDRQTFPPRDCSAAMARDTRPVEARPATLAATRAGVIEHVFSFEPRFVFAKGFNVALRDRLITFMLLPPKARYPVAWRACRRSIG